MKSAHDNDHRNKQTIVAALYTGNENAVENEQKSAADAAARFV